MKDLITAIEFHGPFFYGFSIVKETVLGLVPAKPVTERV